VLLYLLQLVTACLVPLLGKCEGENPGYESSSEESVGEENNRDKRDTDESIEEEAIGV
jgi:hypothetical protein